MQKLTRGRNFHEVNFFGNDGNVTRRFCMFANMISISRQAVRTIVKMLNNNFVRVDTCLRVCIVLCSFVCYFSYV